jgi:hypothetical protein
MLKDEYIDGISLSKVVQIFPTKSLDIFESIKKYHILTYDLQNENFRFHSNSMKIAVKEFLKENKLD